MDSKQRNRLNGGIAIGNAEQRWPEYRQETENEGGECKVKVRRGRADGSARQQQSNADQYDDCTRDPEFPHDSILSCKISRQGARQPAMAQVHQVHALQRRRVDSNGILLCMPVKLRLSLAVALWAGSALAQPPDYGPSKGTLVIQGGGSADGTGIVETFINKAGGLGSKIVVVPTAGGNKAQDGSIRIYKEEQVLAAWKKRGLTNVWMLHTHDPKVADTEEFAKILRDANGVWFDGGRQWNIVDSYANTLTLREFHKVLERGAIAGSEIVMTPEPEHEHGFAFVRKVAIDQHISTRLYQPWEKPYYVLSPGDVYNMKTRAIEKYGTGVVAPPAVLQK
jgi:cyanophycinase